MTVSQDVIKMPKTSITVPVSLDDTNIVIVGCGKFSKCCDLGRLVKLREPYVYAAAMNPKGAAKYVNLFTMDYFMPVSRLYNVTVATCKNCVARHAQKQK